MPTPQDHTSKKSSLPIPAEQPHNGTNPEQGNSNESGGKKKQTPPPLKPYDYSAGPEGLHWWKLDSKSNSWVPVQLTNFKAKILSQSLLDDGQDVHRVYEIQAKLRSRNQSCRVPASQFATMNWVAEYLGAEAVIMPNYGRKDHARTAIQVLSENIPEVRVFAHTGWRDVDGKWIYLHAGGGIGADGEVKNLNVSLHEKLSRYKLPIPPTDGREAICASLAIADVAPLRITIPLLATVYRAAIRESDLTLHLAGPTGGGKSELGGLGQQHYGAEMDAKNLPGAWMSTANANEALAFYAKDALFVVDDFVPPGSRYERSRKNTDADRLIRGQGNGAGRDRMRSDGTIATAKRPRGLILSTGEGTPPGESLRGRMMVVDVEKGEDRAQDDVKWEHLTICQKDARDGRYAEAMAGFVQWLAKRYPEVLKTWRAQFESYRRDATVALAGVDFHGRLPEVIANLAMGWRYFLDYATESNALTKEQAKSWWNTGWATLIEAAKAQVHYRASENPAMRFLSVLASAVASGRAHIANERGNAPHDPEAWGWQLTGERWLPQGDRVGWVKDEHVYLNPDAAMQVVLRFANETGESIPITSETLGKQLKGKALLVSTDETRGTLYVRRTLESRKQNVLHVKWEASAAEDCQADVGTT